MHLDNGKKMTGAEEKPDCAGYRTALHANE